MDDGACLDSAARWGADPVGPSSGPGANCANLYVMRVLVAMSGGVDSSVAAGLLRHDGHDVVGATMKLWGGDSDSGCCSVADVEDARRVASQLGIAHHVFNFTEEFGEKVVGPYVSAYSNSQTPNPCIECNRHLKFDRFLERAIQLGFDAIATGHYAITEESGGRYVLKRGADPDKDQSYVLSMLNQSQLSRCMFPLGTKKKAEVRELAETFGLRTAAKPDSQDVCFITSTSGRAGFLAERTKLSPGRLVDMHSGETLGTVPSVELVTIGQRKGMGSGTGGFAQRKYAVSIDPHTKTVLVGNREDVLSGSVAISETTWVGESLPVGSEIEAQVSAHGMPLVGTYLGDSIIFAEKQRKVAPGQTVAMYVGDEVAGSAIAQREDFLATSREAVSTTSKDGSE